MSSTIRTGVEPGSRFPDPLELSIDRLSVHFDEDGDEQAFPAPQEPLTATEPGSTTHPVVVPFSAVDPLTDVGPFDPGAYARPEQADLGTSHPAPADLGPADLGTDDFGPAGFGHLDAPLPKRPAPRFDAEPEPVRPTVWVVRDDSEPLPESGMYFRLEPVRADGAEPGPVPDHRSSRRTHATAPERVPSPRRPAGRPAPAPAQHRTRPRGHTYHRRSSVAGWLDLLSSHRVGAGVAAALVLTGSVGLGLLR